MNYNKYQADIFPEAAECWKLEELYAAIDQIKQKVQRKQLTCLEQAILRGILSGKSTEQIGNLLSGESYSLIINSTWQLYRYIKTLTATKTKDFNNYKNIPNLLEIAGYKKLFLPDSLEESAEHILQGGNQSLTTISLSADTSIEKQDFLIAPTKIISTERVLRQALLEQCDTNPGSNAVLIERDEENELNRAENPSKSAESALIVANSVSSDTNTLSFVEANDFMPPISLWTRLGGLFMVGSIITAIAVSAFTPYNVTVKAQAKIRPAGELRIIEAKTEGTVVKIHVKENQKVKKGDLIATIDNSRLETKISQLESNIQQATLQLERIQAQITAQENRLEAETEGIRSAIASAQAELIRSRREYQDRNNTANTQVEEAIANLNSTQQELNQAQTELISLEANLKSAQASLNAGKSKRDRYKIIASSGALSQNQLEEAQLDVEQKKQQVIAQQAAIQQQNQEIAKQQQAVAAAQARLNNNQVTLNPSDAEVTIALENIEREKATGQATLSGVKREQEALIQQQIEIQQQQARDHQELQQLDKDFDKTAIIASADGILFQLKLRNSGQNVTLGEEIARITPLSNSLVIKALVSAQEIDKVEIARQVQMKVSACPYPDYGTLKGAVINIAPDSIAPQNSSASSNSATTSSPNFEAGFYQVIIKPESLALGKGKHQCKIQLGMEGKADIIAQEETVLQFLLRKARLLADL